MAIIVIMVATLIALFWVGTLKLSSTRERADQPNSSGLASTAHKLVARTDQALSKVAARTERARVRHSTNHLLASIIGGLNSLIAIGIIVASFALSQSYASYLVTTGALTSDQAQTVIILGTIAGTVVALIFCGFLAVFISINEYLRSIDKLLVDAIRKQNMNEKG